MTPVQGQTSIRLSALAWALAVDKAARANPGGAAPYLESPEAAALTALPDKLRDPLERELRVAGISAADGALDPDWLSAISQASSAPIKAAVVSRERGVSTHCELNLFHGLGLAVEFSRTVRDTPDGGTAVGDVRNSVLVTLFAEEDVWSVVARSLPELTELTADGDAPLGRSEPLGRTERRRVPVSEAAQLERNARATVHFSLAAGPLAVGAPGYRAGHMWLLTDALYEVKTVPPGRSGTDDPPGVVLLSQAPGAIARQLVWDVLGAHEFLAKSAAAGSEAA